MHLSKNTIAILCYISVLSVARIPLENHGCLGFARAVQIIKGPS